ncbi:MAG TPA: ceramide glucosyltransferase [Dissulfurispiraceae bacterium]|nr:ceramide glucosyltransferase [Dissulfurispiraceae bacterium]
MEILFPIFAALSIIGLLAYALQVWAVRCRAAHTPLLAGEEKSSPRLFPSVSILKPLKGLDDNLFDNLESFCRLDYPEYEIICSLQNENDPACKVARHIKEKYPEKDITVHIERCVSGLNPKVNNLIPAYRISKYSHILISDSNVMVRSDYLKSIMPEMQDPSVGLVSNLIRGMGGSSIGAAMENLHLNSFVMGSVSFLDKFLKMPCVVGKSMLMKKEDLEAIGGLAGVNDVLAEDYLIGKKIYERGKRVVLSGHLVDNVNEYWGFRKFLNRHTRWGKLRWQIGGFKYISELICNPVFMAVMPMLLIGISLKTAAFAAGVSLCKLTGDFLIGRKIGTDMTLSSYMLSPLKDIVIGIIWFVPLLSKTVIWRGNRYLIGKDSILSPCPDTGLMSYKYRIFDTIKERLA